MLGCLPFLRIGPSTCPILEMPLFSLFESFKAPPISILSKWLIPTLKVLILGGIGSALKSPGLPNALPRARNGIPRTVPDPASLSPLPSQRMTQARHHLRYGSLSSEQVPLPVHTLPSPLPQAPWEEKEEMDP